MDVLDSVIDHLEGTLDLPTTFKVDVLSGDDNALTIRVTPSTPGNEFLDGSEDDEIAFQVLVKHKSQLKAKQLSEGIADALERTWVYDGLVKCRKTSYPLLVEVTDRNCYLYSTMFSTTIYKGSEI